MKLSLRPTSLDDLSRVRQFLQRAFNARADAPFLDPSVMAWKYWDRRDDWDEPRAYVLERDGVIVAHVGIFPLTFGREARGIQMIDWAGSKEAPGAGVAILQRLKARFDFIYSIGGSEMTQQILPAFGFVEQTRQWKAGRPLRPFRQILSHQRRNWKLVPRLARNTLWTLPRASLGHSHEQWTTEEISPDGISRALFTQPLADASFSPRPPAFFEYLLRCPVMRVHLHGLRDEHGPKGHFAIGVLRGQARVAGVWLLDPNREAWQTAFGLAQQTARGLEGAYEIIAAGTEGLSEQGAAQSGLRVMGYTPVFLLNTNKQAALPPDFQFQLSDDDVFFLDTGNPSFIT